MCVVTGRRWLSLCMCSYREKVAELHIVNIEKLWREESGEAWLSGCWFLRPNETFQLATRKYLPKVCPRPTGGRHCGPGSHHPIGPTLCHRATTPWGLYCGPGPTTQLDLHCGPGSHHSTGPTLCHRAQHFTGPSLWPRVPPPNRGLHSVIGPPLHGAYTVDQGPPPNWAYTVAQGPTTPQGLHCAIGPSTSRGLHCGPGSHHPIGAYTGLGAYTLAQGPTPPRGLHCPRTSSPHGAYTVSLSSSLHVARMHKQCINSHMSKDVSLFYSFRSFSL